MVFVVSGYKARRGFKRQWNNPYGINYKAYRSVYKQYKKAPMKKLQKDMRFLKKAIELKVADTTLVTGVMASFVGSTGSIWIMNQLSQGNNYTQRVGNKICLKDLRVRLMIHWTLSPSLTHGTVEHNGYRIIVVYDKNASSSAATGVPTTTPAFNTIFQDRWTGSPGGTAQSWLSSKNHDMGDRFVVLYDKVRELVPVVNQLINHDTLSDYPAHIRIPHIEDFYVPLKNRESTYVGAEISQGALYLITIAMKNETMVSNERDNHLTLDGAACRLRYYDL